MVIAVDAAYDARLQFIASKLGQVPMGDMMPIIDVIIGASMAIRSHRDVVDEFNDRTGSAVEVEINDAIFVRALYYGWSQPDRSDISGMLSADIFRGDLKPTATDFVNLTAVIS